MHFKLKEMKMPKMKTKSGAKKRFKVTGSGKVKAKAAFARHMQMNKPKSMKRKTRGSMILFKADGEKVVNNWMPGTRKKKSKPAAKKAEGGK